MNMNMAETNMVETTQPLQHGEQPDVGVSREVARVVAGQQTTDGAGVKLTRVLTRDLQRRLDPFLMLDVFASDDPDDYLAGFPDHPHRGFETVTYMLAGRMRHRDSAGHEGVIGSGGVQWMTAGRGIVHSEIPQQHEGVMEGFQLWLNLPARDKGVAPWYRDFEAADLPRFTTADGATVVVIAGTSHGVTGAVTREATQPLFLDVHLPAGTRFAQLLPAGHNAFLYVYRGRVNVAGRAVDAGHMAVLADALRAGAGSDATAADGVVVSAEGDARLLLIAGRPLGEPIVQHGPFVMNSEDEIRQAIVDLRSGRFGRADG